MASRWQRMKLPWSAPFSDLGIKKAVGAGQTSDLQFNDKMIALTLEAG